MNVSRNFRPSDFQAVIAKLSLLDHMISSKSIKIAVEEFLTEHRIGHSSANTISFYADNLNQFLKFPGIPHNVGEVEKSHVLAFLGSKTDKPYRADAFYRSLRAFFNWAIKENYAAVNPVEQCRRPTLPKPEIETLTTDEFKTALASLDRGMFLGKRNYAMLLILFDTGMRLDELTTLTFSDMNIEEGLIRIKFGKGKKERIAHIGEMTRKALWDYLKMHGGKSPDIWLTEERRPITQNTVIQMVKSVSQRTSIHIHPHLLRHTFAINYLRNGGDIVTLQYLLGHEKIATTMVYLKALNSDDAIKAHKKFSPADRLL